MNAAPGDELQTQASSYALTWGRQQLGQLRALALLPCSSQLFFPDDQTWIARPTLADGKEAEPFLIAWRQGQFAARMIEDFVLSIAGKLESSWRQRGYPEATFVSEWHPPIEDLVHPDLVDVSEQDDAWVLEIATSLDFSASTPLPAIFSIIWLHYLKQTDVVCEIRVIHTTSNPFLITGEDA